MMILAFDQSPTVTGWAVGDGADLKPKWGTIKHPDYGDNEALLMAAVYDQTINLAKPYGVEAIFTEQLVLGSIHPRKGQAPSANVKTFFKKCAVMLAMHFAAKRGFNAEPYEAPIGAWREYFIGTGSAPKGIGDNTAWLKDCAKQECARNGMLVENDHEAEAIGIWHYAQSLLDVNFRRIDGPRRRRAAQARDDERHAGLIVRKRKPGNELR